MASLAFERVSVDFVTPGGSAYRAVNEVSFDVAAGAFVAIVGPSGCGKSTLLNVAAGLRTPAAGAVTINGVPLTGLNRDATYMFQQDALLPWKNVRDNVALGLVLAGASRPAAASRADEWLARVGLERVRAHYPAQLSGGMRKRVAMAQNWILDRPIVLMDEPFSARSTSTRGSEWKPSCCRCGTRVGREAHGVVRHSRPRGSDRAWPTTSWCCRRVPPAASSPATRSPLERPRDLHGAPDHRRRSSSSAQADVVGAS
mgnify:CR=1 FL=1